MLTLTVTLACKPNPTLTPTLTVTRYDSSVDMWALGVVCYMLLSGTRPFHHQDRHEKKRRICHDPLQFPSPGPWDHVSDAAKDFCNKLMQKNPKDRMPASEAVHRYPYISLYLPYI